jgi:hypothetical protein
MHVLILGRMIIESIRGHHVQEEAEPVPARMPAGAAA